MTFKERLGKKITLLRNQQKLSQNKLAAKLNIRQQTLCAYEQGRVSISAETLVKICHVLDAPLSWFLPSVKQYGDVIKEEDIELLTELHRLADTQTLLAVARTLNQSHVKKIHRLTE